MYEIHVYVYTHICEKVYALLWTGVTSMCWVYSSTVTQTFAYIVLGVAEKLPFELIPRHARAFDTVDDHPASVEMAKTL